MQTYNKRINGKDMIKMGDKWFKLTKSGYGDYISFVSGNKEDSFILAEKKLNRNIRAGKYLRTKSTNILVYGFGYLRIGLRDNHIIFVENHVKPSISINRELKDELDIKYGIKPIEFKDEEIQPVYEGVGMFYKIMKMFGLHS
jgi:hypothetical protein